MLVFVVVHVAVADCVLISHDVVLLLQDIPTQVSIYVKIDV